MPEWSPPRLWAVTALAFVAILSCLGAPTSAKPFPQENGGDEHPTGGYHKLSEGLSAAESKSQNVFSRHRRSLTVDDSAASLYSAHKRHGIETPIEPLETKSDESSTSNGRMVSSLRSKVDQPESDNIKVSSADGKTSDNGKVPLSNSENQKEASESVTRQSEGSEQTTEQKRDSSDDKETSDKAQQTTVQQQVNTPATHEAGTQNNAQDADKKGLVSSNNKEMGEITTTQNSARTSTGREKIPTDKDSPDASKVTADPPATASAIKAPGGSSRAPLSEESQTSPEPIKDKLGTSGSEIVTTTHEADEERLPYDRDAESKTSGPEVGHFQVDDKSADLEINANSAGVKVKAKPASLQVVSKPGSHSAAADAPLARSFYDHYRYPPLHRPHPWLPAFRTPLRRHHMYHPYGFYPRDWLPARHRYEYDPEFLDAPLYGRRSWYHHHRRHHYHRPYLYGRSHMEAPVRRSRFHYGEPWGRRYRRRFHRSKAPLRRRLYDRFGIPVTNNFASANMNVPPEADTLPQLPFNPQVAGQMMLPPAQRQNIVTPMPAPINLIGNPPPSIMSGTNLMGVSGMSNFGAMNALGGLGGAGDYSGLTGLTGVNGMEGGAGDGMSASTGGLGDAMAGLEGVRGSRRQVEAGLPENGGAPVKKAAIQSSKAAKTDLKQSKRDQHASKRRLDLKGWAKLLVHHNHDHMKDKKTPHRIRRAEGSAKHGQTNGAKRQRVQKLKPEKSKDEKGSRKNAVIIHRPPIIYHPPPEIYHRPAIVVHRAPIMLHRAPIVYHQPPVVVHRPAIIYHQPPLVFHQPPPVVNQPIMHSHDSYVTRPVVYHTNSLVSHANNYLGVPENVYPGAFGCHGPHCAFRKAEVPSSAKKKNKPVKRSVDSQFEFIASDEGARERLTFHSKDEAGRTKRESLTDDHSGQTRLTLHRDREIPTKRQKRWRINREGEIPTKKKKDVVVNRPPIIYHPPPEIYHRPDIVVHRPPLVIHRPPIIYHQPPVIVHRPAVVYHQPPIVFHQPPPAVSQPLLYSHDSFVVHPSVYASHHGSVVRDAGHYVGMPNVISSYGHPLFGMPHFPMGKRSVEEKERSSTPNEDKQGKSKSENVKSTGTSHQHPSKETSEKAGKKNSVMIDRPPIIYHPPPEVYHRPVIVVHRAPIMLHRAPIVYHQPPVVVHRPAIVYHQPPLVFHQPPPVVNQPVVHSHDTWIRRPIAIPYSSHISHHSTYVGVPDSFTTHAFHHYGGHGIHGHAFYKSSVPKTGQPVQERAAPKDKIEKNAPEKHHSKTSAKKTLKRGKSHSEKGGKKNAVIVKRPPVIYHPPPEIYHRPDIIIHRAPIMLQRAPIIYHQPPVIVHRPAVVYHQPSLIFHQPPPVVHQAFVKSHDTWMAKPAVALYSSQLHHAGHMYHVPDAYFYHGHGAVHSMGYGKSKVLRKSKLVEEDSDARGVIKKRKLKQKQAKHHAGKKKHISLRLSKVKTETGAKLHMGQKNKTKYSYHKEKEKTESGAKKNAVIIHRPPIIYHPPPEVYHRPNIVVHRAPIVLYRAPIIYHQPPVVVHRPAIVYHQPPLVFHQPPPTVHQPILHSHDTYLARSVAVPYSSHVHHAMTYRGVPHEELFMHGYGEGAFTKSFPSKSRRRNKISQHKSKHVEHSARSQEKHQDASVEKGAQGKVRRSISTAREAPWGLGTRILTPPVERDARLRSRRGQNDSQAASEGERPAFMSRYDVDARRFHSQE